MLKDLPANKVEDVAMAIVPEFSPEGDKVWNVYLINLKQETIEGVLVTSKGYGFHEGEKVKTSILRHFLDKVPPHDFAKVEPIVENIFGLNNEYWVSFYVNKVMFDKKYLFLPETISEEFFTFIPVIEKKGVMIK
ncbi:MAG: hypothetical protein ABI855_05000 [Bacteroidota bacterium]